MDVEGLVKITERCFKVLDPVIVCDGIALTPKVTMAGGDLFQQMHF